jgi:hypothetical protein
MTHTERRELTAAEIDLVGGGRTYTDDFLIVEGVISSSSWGVSQTGTNGVMYDVTQNRTA